jgi:hypothetical protein
MDDLSTLLHDAVSDVEPTDRLAEIREAVAPARPRRLGWYAAGGGFLAAAAAVTAIALIANGTTPTAEDDDPGPIAPPETVAVAVAVYYVGDTARGPRLYREFHDLAERSPESALAELMLEPDDPDYETYWQPGQLLGAIVDGDVIKVEVDPALTGPTDGVPAADLMLEQVIYTVQAAVGEGRLPVQFVSPNGNPVAEVLGLPTSEPLANGAELDVLSLVSISDPVEGLVVTDSFIARGAASSFEGNVPWTLTASDGTTVREGFATAGMDTHLVRWETEAIDVSDLAPGRYTFEARTEGGKPFTDTRTVVIE